MSVAGQGLCVWVPNVVTPKIRFRPNGPFALELYNPTIIDLKNDRKWPGGGIRNFAPQGATKIMSEKSDSLPTGQENVPEQGGRLRGRGALSKTRAPMGDDPKLCLTLTTVNAKPNLFC